VLTVEPRRGPCPVADPPVTLRGANFPPGLTIGFYLVQVRGREDQRTYGGGAVTVGADGTFAIMQPLVSCGPDVPAGTLFSFVTLNGPFGSRSGAYLAGATFTVDPAAAPVPDLPNTGGGGGQARMPPPAGLLVAGVLVAALGGLAACGGRRWRRAAEMPPGPSLFRARRATLPRATPALSPRRR
jgi:hypothetical protein